MLLGSRLSGLFVGDGFRHFAGLEAAGTDVNPADRSVLEADLDLLEVGVETAAGDSGNFLTNTAGLFGKTAA